MWVYISDFKQSAWSIFEMTKNLTLNSKKCEIYLMKKLVTKLRVGIFDEWPIWGHTTSWRQEKGC